MRAGNVPANEERPGLTAEPDSHLSAYFLENVEPRRLIQFYGLPQPIARIASLLFFLYKSLIIFLCCLS
jgi:hypothetical protein